MDRRFYLDLAAAGARFPIGTHLLLHEQANPHAVELDGQALGQVIEKAARRYRTPLALPLMDLTLEKQDMLTMLGIPAAEIDSYHFHQPPSMETVDRVRQSADAPLTPRMKASVEAIRYIATRTDLVPVGMGIGPFSLMTKLLADPITPVYLAGSGSTAETDPEVAAVEQCLEMALIVIERSLRHQAQAGAKAVVICEPAANKVYLSPNQLDAGSDIFQKFVMVGNRRVKALLDELGCDLIFHDCGELLDPMVQAFTTLDPVLLSLGSSRRLWEDARLVPDDIVMYGNLPTKKFYSDAEVPLESVEQMTRELILQMRRAGKPYIVGSECDVLSVVGSEQTIRAKVDRMMGCQA